MSWLQRLSLRWRMLVFGAIALLPIVGLAIFHAWDETDTVLKEKRTEVANLVEMMANEQTLHLALGEQLIATLALNPVIVVPKDRNSCGKLLKQALADDQHIGGIGLFSAEGEPVCASSANLPPPIADRMYFQEALRRKQPVVSDYLISRRSGKAAVALAHPVLDEARNVSHVLVAGLDLAWLARTLEKTPLPSETNLVVVDSRGTVLAPEKWLGRSVADHPVFRRVANIGEATTFEARGLDGVERIFAARPLHATLGGNIYLWAAVNKSAVMQDAIVDYIRGSLPFFLMAIVLFLIIWAKGSRLVLDPIESLQEAARRMGATDLKARTGLPHGNDEIGRLATSFDEMAEAIESRETELLRSNRALRVLSAGNQALVRANEKTALLDEMCQVATAEGGYRMAWIGRAEHDPARTITILASAGIADRGPEAIDLSWAASDPDAGPAATALQEIRPVAVHDIQALPRASPWRRLAARHGCGSMLSLPVTVDGRVWGVFCLCAEQAEAFDEAEMRLLFEMGADLGFGIETLRLRRKEAAARDALLRINEELEARVAERTADLEQANRELEAFSYSASHDLRAPLRAIAGFAEVLHEDYGQRLDDEGRAHLARIRKAAIRMGQLIDDLLQLARVSRSEMSKAPVDLSGMARDILDEVATDDPGRGVKTGIQEGLAAEADPVLLRVALQNLLENAWKYSSRRPDAEIAFGAQGLPDGRTAYFVRDNGCGFDMANAGRLFQSFVRLHGGEEYPGTGIGLATVARVIERHGGRVWAEAEKGKGATFYFTLN